MVRQAIPQLHDIEGLTRMVDRSVKGKYPLNSLSYFVDIISGCFLFVSELKFQVTL